MNCEHGSIIPIWHGQADEILQRLQEPASHMIRPGFLSQALGEDSTPRKTPQPVFPAMGAGCLNQDTLSRNDGESGRRRPAPRGGPSPLVVCGY